MKKGIFLYFMNFYGPFKEIMFVGDLSLGIDVIFFKIIENLTFAHSLLNVHLVPIDQLILPWVNTISLL
jgi:hypothetical protein